MRLPKMLFHCMAVLAGAALVAGCGNSPVSPGVQPEISNVVDNFQYQVTNIRNYTHEDSYAWQNTGAVANVNQATTITGGSATLVIRDGAGIEVYSRSLAENGSFVSTTGTPRSWTIRVTYASASATVNFRVQKAP